VGVGWWYLGCDLLWVAFWMGCFGLGVFFCVVFVCRCGCVGSFVLLGLLVVLLFVFFCCELVVVGGLVFRWGLSVFGLVGCWYMLVFVLYVWCVGGGGFVWWWWGVFGFFGCCCGVGYCSVCVSFLVIWEEFVVFLFGV